MFKRWQALSLVGLFVAACADADLFSQPPAEADADVGLPIWADGLVWSSEDAGLDAADDSETADATELDDAASGQGVDAAGPPDAAPPPPPTPPTGVPEDCVRVRVLSTGGIGLNVRPDPSTANPPVDNLPDGSVVDVLSIVEGQNIEGTTRWFEIQRGDTRGFITGHWAECLGPPSPTDDVFLLPFACGQSYRVTQGNNTDFSHSGRSAWAFDFSMPLDTPMLAMRAGTVVFADGGTGPGSPCYSGGGQECINDANYVVVSHADGSTTQYAHLNRVDVGVGDTVSQGHQLGLSGSTGWSTGPHAHIERSEGCGRAFCQTVPIDFADVPGGRPGEGEVVTSQNGCGAPR